MTTQSADSIAPAIPLSLQPTDAISAEVLETAAHLGVAQYLPQVVDLTREIYGGFTGVSVSVDPEIPDDTHIVFHVLVHCSVGEALDMDVAWGRRLRKIVPRCPRVFVPSADFQP